MLWIAALLAVSQADPPQVVAWRALLVDRKDAQAFAEVEKAAASDDPEALDFLGWFYDVGRVKAVDRRKAAELYRRAAVRGQRHAQWRFGVMLDTGDGVAVDPAEAVRWFERSAAQRFTNAYVSLGVMYSDGRGVPKDQTKALEEYRAAAKLGNIHAFNEIGVAYLLGEGVPADKMEATAYFIIAATAGDKMGQQYLQSTAQEFDKTMMDRAAARATAINKEFRLP